MRGGILVQALAFAGTVNANYNPITSSEPDVCAVIRKTVQVTITVTVDKFGQPTAEESAAKYPGKAAASWDAEEVTGPHASSSGKRYGGKWVAAEDVTSTSKKYVRPQSLSDENCEEETSSEAGAYTKHGYNGDAPVSKSKASSSSGSGGYHKDGYGHAVESGDGYKVSYSSKSAGYGGAGHSKNGHAQEIESGKPVSAIKSAGYGGTLHSSDGHRYTNSSLASWVSSSKASSQSLAIPSSASDSSLSSQTKSYASDSSTSSASRSSVSSSTSGSSASSTSLSLASSPASSFSSLSSASGSSTVVSESSASSTTSESSVSSVVSVSSTSSAFSEPSISSASSESSQSQSSSTISSFSSSAETSSTLSSITSSSSTIPANCVPPTGSCIENGDCCNSDSGVFCDSGTCTVPTEDCINDLETGCEINADCCSNAQFGTTCVVGLCIPAPFCLSEGQGTCTSNLQCCDVLDGANCIEGSCQLPDCIADLATGCTDDDQCCRVDDGSTCVLGMCTPATEDCLEDDEGTCTADADCCDAVTGGSRCVDNVCTAPPFCTPDGGTCTANSECCNNGNGIFCNGGTCSAVQQCPVQPAVGGFENIQNVNTIEASEDGWTLSGGGAFFATETNNAYSTPYGQQFVAFGDTYVQGVIGSLSRTLQVTPLATYTVSYAYYVGIVAMDSFSLTVKYNGVAIKELNFNAFTTGANQWQTDSFEFQPLINGVLAFEWSAGERIDITNFADLLLDNIQVRFTNGGVC